MPYVRLRTGSAPVPARSHFVAAFCRPPRAPSWWPAGPTPTNRARGACSWSPHVTGTWAAPAPRRTRARVAALSPVTTSTFVVVRRVCLHGPLSWCVLLGAARTEHVRPRPRAPHESLRSDARGTCARAARASMHPVLARAALAAARKAAARPVLARPEAGRDRVQHRASSLLEPSRATRQCQTRIRSRTSMDSQERVSKPDHHQA